LFLHYVHASTYGGEERRIQSFGGEDHLKDPGADGKIILIWFFQEAGWGNGLD